jgi:hypothetical protein
MGTGLVSQRAALGSFPLWPGNRKLIPDSAKGGSTAFTMVNRSDGKCRCSGAITPPVAGAWGLEVVFWGGERTGMPILPGRSGVASEPASPFSYRQIQLYPRSQVCQ